MRVAKVFCVGAGEGEAVMLGRPVAPEAELSGEALEASGPEQLRLMSIMHNINRISPSAQIIIVYMLLLVLPRRRLLLAAIMFIPKGRKRPFLSYKSMTGEY